MCLMFVHSQLAQIVDDGTGSIQRELREFTAHADVDERREGVRKRHRPPRRTEEARHYRGHAAIGDATREGRHQRRDARNLVDDDDRRPVAHSIDVALLTLRGTKGLHLEAFEGKGHDAHGGSSLWR